MKDIQQGARMATSAILRRYTKKTTKDSKSAWGWCGGEMLLQKLCCKKFRQKQETLRFSHHLFASFSLATASRLWISFLLQKKKIVFFCNFNKLYDNNLQGGCMCIRCLFPNRGVLQCSPDGLWHVRECSPDKMFHIFCPGAKVSSTTPISTHMHSNTL